MINLIFTLDYEIHGNGTGDPVLLMVRPAYKLMDLMERYGARLTIFADMAEIMKFREYYEKEGYDRFGYLEIKKQLQEAVLKGHDVQLHIHSSYINSEFDGRKWVQSWEEYNFAGLGYERISKYVSEYKTYLEGMIREKVPGYSCYAFRAANWAMQPTPDIAKALIENGISIDSSVYKYGSQRGWVNYDYSDAFEGTFPYRASTEDICLHDPESKLWEFPIYCELRPVIHFFTPMRVYRALRAIMHRHRRPNDKGNNEKSKDFIKSGKRLSASLFKKYPLKYDFNQLSGRQMISIAKTLAGRLDKTGYVTLIGHSKTFTWYNSITLGRFLKYLAGEKSRYSFAVFPHDPQSNVESTISDNPAT